MRNLICSHSFQEIRFPQNTVLFLLTDGLYASQGVRRALVSLGREHLLKLSLEDVWNASVFLFSSDIR